MVNTYILLAPRWLGIDDLVVKPYPLPFKVSKRTHFNQYNVS